MKYIGNMQYYVGTQIDNKQVDSRQQTHFLENIKKIYMGRQQTHFLENIKKYIWVDSRQQTVENIKKNIWVDSRQQTVENIKKNIWGKKYERFSFFQEWVVILI